MLGPLKSVPKAAGGFDSKGCYGKKGERYLPTGNTCHGGVHQQPCKVTAPARGGTGQARQALPQRCRKPGRGGISSGLLLLVSLQPRLTQSTLDLFFQQF